MSNHEIDLAFLREPSNWWYGPVFEMVHRYPGLGLTRSLMSTFLELQQVTGAFHRSEDITPESVPLPSGVHNALCILHDPKTDLGPLGARFFCTEHEDLDETFLYVAIYPRQMRRICGDYPWSYRTEDWVTLAVVEFHKSMIQISLDLYLRKPFNCVSLHDEAQGMCEKSGIAVPLEVAEAAAWPVVKESGFMAIMDIDEWSAEYGV